MTTIQRFRQLVSPATSLVKREVAAGRCKPLTATLEMTYRCNLHCRMCRVTQKGQHREKDELDTAQVIATIDELQALGVEDIALIGAEAFLRKDAVEVIAAIAARGITSSVTTNGTLLSKTTIDRLLDVGLQKITISIDAPTAAHNDIRGAKILDTVVEAVRCLVQARRSRQQQVPWINVHCTLSTLNVMYLASMIPFCEQLGVDSLSFQYLAETTAEQVQGSVFMGKVIASERFVPSEQSLCLEPGQIPQFEDGIEALRHYRGRLKISHRAISGLSGEALISGSLPIQRCYWLRSHVSVDPYGSVYPCANIDGYTYGNVREARLAELWYGERAQALRKRVAQELFPVCRGCCHFSSNWTAPQIARYLITRSI